MMHSEKTTENFMNYKTSVLRFPKDVATAAALIRLGECVALKTETVYGLAADATNEDAIGRVFEAKGRPADNPLIVHIESVDDMSHWAKDIPDIAYTLADVFWPGPLSLLLKKQHWVSDKVTGGHDTIVLRVPASENFMSLIRATKKGLAAPSANKYKFISPTCAEHVLRSLDGRIAAVVDGGQSDVGIESTILDITTPIPTIVRPGPIDDLMIEQALSEPVKYADNLGVTVPGSAKQHYQPNTPVQLLSTEALSKMQLRADEGVISHTADSVNVKSKNCNVLRLPKDPAKYSAHFYSSLYQLDMQNLRCIYLEETPSDNLWLAINNRIGRVVAR
ncbi:threonylcarbamoyl-AMP synthase [Alteromonas gracilis]|uniref:Threonylcarbamoyl-AMP synthase n=2 Tax=Alteromonas gracilis TaxID=1479524 RepID=A0ABX5CR39_9ALTE|nr:threonylcarbamoyl-AMP synthase [Alteromonas gracilis]